MRLERKKNTIRNMFWGFTNRIVALLGPFLIRTIIIYTLGTDYLGLSSLFSSVLQVLSMAELGFGSAVAFSMYEPIAKNNTELICALLNLFNRIYKFIGFVILIMGIALIPFLRYFIHGNIPYGMNIYILYILYLGNTSVSYFLFAYKNVIFSAYQREDIINKIYTFLLFIQYCIQIIILMISRNYYYYYIIVPLISIVNNILVNVFAKKYYPKLVPKGVVSKKVLSEVKEKVSGIVISKFCGLTRNTFDNIIISMFLGLTTVAIYSNYYYIMSNIASVIVIITTSMKAGIGNSLVLDSKEKNFKDYNKFTFLYYWIISICAVCLLCIYQTFMKIWVGSKNMFPFYIVVLICIYFFWMLMADITNAYSGAAGLWWENRYRTFWEAVFNLILNISLGYYFGVFGIVLATVITIFFFNFIWQTRILFKFYFNEFSFKEHIFRCLKYSVLTAMISIITLFICNIVDLGNIANLLYRCIICMFVPNILFYLIYKKDKIFIEVKYFILNMIRQKINCINK